MGTRTMGGVARRCAEDGPAEARTPDQIIRALHRKIREQDALLVHERRALEEARAELRRMQRRTSRRLRALC